MFCKNCGNQIEEGQKFCRNCGAPTTNEMNDNIINNEPSQQINQQPVAQNQGMNQNNNGSDKKNLIILIAIVIILALGFVVGYLLIKDKDKDNESGTDKSSNKSKYSDVIDDSDETDDIINLDDIDNLEDDDDEDKENNGETSTTYTYKNFKFNKISGYTYTTSSQGLQITDLSDVIVLDVVAGNFDLVKTNTSTVESTFKAQGYDIKNVEVKSYGGVEYITSEVTKDNISMLILYTKADNSHTFVIGVTNTKFTVDYDSINTVNKIIKGVTYEG